MTDVLSCNCAAQHYMLHSKELASDLKPFLCCLSLGGQVLLPHLQWHSRGTCWEVVSCCTGFSVCVTPPSTVRGL